MRIFTLILFLFLFAFAKAQENKPAVELIEDKQAKRWLLYAQNNTDIEQEAFLIVQGEGFRRSADRPVIKKIPPQSKVLMITLVPLKGVTPTYTKIFTFEEQLQTIEKRKGEHIEEHVNLKPIKPEEFTVFTEADCKKCDLLLNHLNSKHLNYRKLDIQKHYKVRELMFKHLENSRYTGGMISMPVILYNGDAYFDIVDVERFIATFNWSRLK